MKKMSFALLLLILGLAFRFYREFQFVMKEPITAWTESKSADCAVVLTGGPGRVREGFDLLSNRQIKKLIISGVHITTELDDLLPLRPVYGEINDEDIVLDRRSTTTFGNAQQSLPLVEALKCRDVILVTSRLHMFRAYRTFRETFPESLVLVKHSIYGSTKDQRWGDTLFETVKSFFYSILGLFFF